jgi:hypothetical protein
MHDTAAFLNVSPVDTTAPGRNSPVKGVTSLAELVERTQTPVTTLRERASKVERARQISEDVTRAFRDAGLFRLMQPRRYGGHEYGFTAFVDVTRFNLGTCGGLMTPAPLHGVAEQGFERRYGLRLEIRFPSRAPGGITDATIPLPQLAAHAPACGQVIVAHPLVLSVGSGTGARL